MTSARGFAALAIILSTALVSRDAAADEQTTRAAQLFTEAKELLKSGQAEAACPKLEESQKLDPGAGTQFNLADCYERVGRLATAWKTFRDLESVLVRVDDKERAELAHTRAAALEPRVPKITIVTAPDRAYDGLVVMIDDAPLDRANATAPQAVDPGEHKVAFQAPRHRPQTITIVAAASQVRDVAVPVLEDDAPVVVVREGPDRGSARKTLALIVGGAGIAALGGGVVLGAIAKTKYDDATVGCRPVGDQMRCPELGRAAKADDAKSLATIGTIVGAVGLGALAAGIVLWITAPKREAPRSARTWMIAPSGIGGTF